MRGGTASWVATKSRIDAVGGGKLGNHLRGWRYGPARLSIKASRDDFTGSGCVFTGGGRLFGGTSPWVASKSKIDAMVGGKVRIRLQRWSPSAAVGLAGAAPPWQRRTVVDAYGGPGDSGRFPALLAGAAAANLAEQEPAARGHNPDRKRRTAKVGILPSGRRNDRRRVELCQPRQPTAQGRARSETRRIGEIRAVLEARLDDLRHEIKADRRARGIWQAEMEQRAAMREMQAERERE